MWKSYFNLTKGERNASIILIVLIVLTAVYPLVDASFVKPQQADFSDFRRYAESLSKDSAAIEDTTESTSNEKTYSTRHEPKKFRFDPNTATIEELQSLGFRKYIAERIAKYRKAGGKFKQKDDLSKIYGIDQGLVKSLWNEIDLPENHVGEVREWEREIKQSPKPSVIDINTADTTVLIALPGIGAKLAKRIVDFRTKLGGFYSLEQLKEVYGLKPETIDILMPKLVLDLSAIRLLDLNKASFEELEKHPYVSRNLATAIVSYRHQHGDYKSLEDIRKIVLLDDVTYKKLINYIKL